MAITQITELPYFYLNDKGSRVTSTWALIGEMTEAQHQEMLSLLAEDNRFIPMQLDSYHIAQDLYNGFPHSFDHPWHSFEGTYRTFPWEAAAYRSSDTVEEFLDRLRAINHQWDRTTTIAEWVELDTAEEDY